MKNSGPNQHRVAPDLISAVRRFNRFYTRQIGVLRRTYLDSPYSLAEMRVLYEIAQSEKLGAQTASDIGRTLDLDAGYLSRVLRNFEKAGLISRKASPEDARQSHLALTAKGVKTYAPYEKRSQDNVATMLNVLPPADQSKLTQAMATIEQLLEEGTSAKPSIVLCDPKHGDFGWIVTRHAQVYADEYGWGDPFEGLCAQIVADYVNNYDPKTERCWIAEVNGENAGCVMLVKDKEPGTARIRLLLVDPKGRGLGLGTRLTGECVTFAREAGYTKVTLWTHSVLTAARHCYEKAGFRLTSSEPRHTWGKDVVAEFWDLTL
ncbi:MAG TPA: helix-turn-helix domain-containing GNAT family N-acetyltransferase [Pseudolabrys sp.]|jgi:DNA-binding MarR family transcriptional regulator/N-acetylglutamate synthase-like GNAT family acetyltransferase